MPRCLVSLGSNLGDRHATFDRAVEALAKLADLGTLRASTRRESAPIGGPAGQQAFLNGAVSFHSQLRPVDLLAGLLEIERAHDRERHARWGERSLDLDLLLYGEAVIRSPELRVPHPRMTFRPFVLQPACEIAGDWPHPECEKTLAVLLEILRFGRGTLSVLHDPAGEIRKWVGDARPRLVVESSACSAPTQLSIDAGTSGHELGPSGPRLVLADCPREHWREEVAAALECVWPASPDTPGR